MSKGTAVEYDFLTRRIAEWEEIYERDEHGRERDIRDDLLTLYRRQHEIELETVFALRRQASGAGKATHPAGSAVTPLDRGELLDWLHRFLNKIGKRLVANARERHEQK